MQTIVRLIVVVLVLAAPFARAAEAPLVVFAAASLTNALEEASEAYTKGGGSKVELSFAASSALARQIEAGAKADLFFSADVDWMDYLQTRSLIDPASRHDVLRNRLVLIAPKDSKIALRIAPNFPLAVTLGENRLATGDPDSVPVGRYARDALTNLGVWNQISERIVRTDNVRVALAYVARGEAALGIVYATDASIEKKVRVVAVFPDNTHAPIVYPLALTRTAKSATQNYAAYLSGQDAAAIFEKHGFAPIARQ